MNTNTNKDRLEAKLIVLEKALINSAVILGQVAQQMVAIHDELKLEREALVDNTPKIIETPNG